VRIPCLQIGEIERLLNVWHVKGSSPKGERWTDRAKQGAQWTRGYQYIPVTRQALRTFLQNECGPVGKQLDTFFDQRQPFNRSDKAQRTFDCTRWGRTVDASCHALRSLALA
jgi:hypothetical protein